MMRFKDIVENIKVYWSKRSSTSRIGLVLFFVVYLIIPQPFIIVAGGMVLFASFQVVKKVSHWFYIAIPAIMIIYALGLSLFILMLFLTTDSVTEDEYVITEDPLTTREEFFYKEMIYELDFYQVDPINTDHILNFEMLSLVGYRRGYWFNRAPKDHAQLLMTPHSNLPDVELEIYLYNQSGAELAYYSFMDNIHEVIRYEVPEDIISIIIQIENIQGDILYDSGEIAIYHDIDYNPNQIAKGGQYDPNPVATYVLNAFAAHLGALFIITMLVSVNNTYQKWIKKVTK
ncbi:MAG: hypothetical protein EP317_02535 [Bacillota bacterium]|nr:MAG: hypothetical protein EP317_02535 [Bacillota bacterium]